MSPASIFVHFDDRTLELPVFLVCEKAEVFREQEVIFKLAGGPGRNAQETLKLIVSSLATTLCNICCDRG